MNTATLARAVRPTDALALAVMLALFVASLAVYEAVPAEMVVHYTPPGGVYYGIETLPKALGLFVVPVVALVTFGVARLLPLTAGSNEAFAAIAPYYHAGLVGLVVLLGAVHAVLVLLNL
jgi:hypothetical protein